MSKLNEGNLDWRQSLDKYTWHLGDLTFDGENPDDPPHLPESECKWIFNEIQRRNKARKPWSESELETEYERLHAEGKA